jgi:predicted Zn-ribbon and HTH transcriptional regulator
MRRLFVEDRKETIRRDILEILKEKALTIKDISKIVKIPEKTVVEHLEHISKTITHEGFFLKVTPASCLHCGFIFKKRDRMRKPGKCPICRSEHIKEPLFKIEK